MRPRVLKNMQAFAELEEHVARLIGLHLAGRHRSALRRLASRHDRALFRRGRHACGGRIVMRAGAPRSDVVFSETRVHELEIEKLHIP